MSLPPTEIKHHLLARGAELSVGLSAGEIDQWQDKLKIDLDPFWRQMYMEFNGFSDLFMDHYAAICVWPIDRVVEQHQEEPLADHKFAFADFMINSDYLIGDLSDSNRPIMAEEQGVVLAQSIQEFWEKFVSGDFDVISD